MKAVWKSLGVLALVAGGAVMATPAAAAPAVAAEVIVAAPAAAPVAVAAPAPAVSPTGTPMAVGYPSDHAQSTSGEFSALGLCNYSDEHPAISYGSTQHAAVAHAQCLLRNYHGYNIAVDGIFGNGTRNAVINFQSSNGLYADGIIGQLTWNALHPGLD
ncbi:peptidoglycan-binding protein [uncultured Cellulomonas sp.]|uniref:peptidoglycan-binding domain-containing protein n=1 Tax=uncultured Cellulomonas sp. TaxID=189682 RepID=UPI00262B8CB6|nr:peptidoglycan-binding domain-containing protein [uncultured Cellulomonas sp.]